MQLKIKQTLLSFFCFGMFRLIYHLKRNCLLQRQFLESSDKALLFGRQLVLDFFVFVKFHRLKKKKEKNNVLVVASPQISKENKTENRKKLRKNKTSKSLLISGNS